MEEFFKDKSQYTYTFTTGGSYTIDFNQFKEWDGGISKKLDSISVTRTPSKTAYLIGEALNTSGIEITALYQDGSEETIDPNSAEVNFDYGFSQSGMAAVAVAYKGKAATFIVTVFPLSITVTNTQKTSRIEPSVRGRLVVPKFCVSSASSAPPREAFWNKRRAVETNTENNYS